MIRTSVQTGGPIFNGQGPSIVVRSARDMEEHLAEVGADMVRTELMHVLRRETPYYRTQITTTEMYGRHVITDGGVVYGPWLEGTSERNKTTRFKGYATFRRMAQKLDADSVNIVREQVFRMVRELNG